MPTEATTTPADVKRYVETDLTDSEVYDYIDDAEDEALMYNAVEDFRDGELDRLVKFYSALLIEERADAGGDVKTMSQGSRSVAFTTEREDRNPVGWLRTRVRANDPSGQLLEGRNNSRHVSFAGGNDTDSEDTG